jgi:hypothetical protein
VLNKSLKLDEISDSDDDIADVTDDSNAIFEEEELRKSRHSINQILNKNHNKPKVHPGEFNMQMKMLGIK